jgi:tetratricopeptide (TPR) repeat protein
MKHTIATTLLVVSATAHAASPTTVANPPGVNAASSRCQGAPPDSIKAAVILGDCLREEKNDKAAVEAYRRGLATDPHGSRELFLGMALAYDALKKYDLELQSAFSADHLAPSDPEVLYQTGIAYENLEEWPEALDYFNRTLAVRPNDGRAHRNIGFVLLQQDKPEEAIRPLETAIEIDQNDWKAHLNLSGARFLPTTTQYGDRPGLGAPPRRRARNLQASSRSRARRQRHARDGGAYRQPIGPIG